MVRYSNGFKLTGTCLSGLGLILLASNFCGPTSQTVPPDEFGRVYPVTLRLKDGSPLLKIEFSSRGIQKLTTGEEPELDWIYQGAYSAWDYTEWHWWKGHPFDFQARRHENPAYWDSFRPRFQGNPRVDAGKIGEGYLEIDFGTDGFEFQQAYLLPDAATPGRGYWDMFFTAVNATGRQIEEYGHFFACYTSINGSRSFWFWAAGGELALWSERGVGHLDGYVSSPAAYFAGDGGIPHCPRGNGRLMGTWRHPVLVSHASPAGWRSVILLDPETTAAVTSGMEGTAMDFIFYPGHKKRVFPSGGRFRSHLRHLMIKSPGLPTREQLEDWWMEFRQAGPELERRLGEFRN